METSINDEFHLETILSFFHVVLLLHACLNLTAAELLFVFVGVLFSDLTIVCSMTTTPLAVGYQYPWAMLALAVLMGSDPVPDLIGIFAGHVFYFLIDVGPNKYADVSWCRCTVASCYWWRHARLFRVANMCSVFACG